MLYNHGRDSAGEEALLPLCQVSGGGPTQASVAENGAYWTGKLCVDRYGHVVFVTDEVYEKVLGANRAHTGLTNVLGGTSGSAA